MLNPLAANCASRRLEIEDEARVLPLRRSAAGTRVRTWATMSDDVREEPFADWPVGGPRSASWCVDFLMKEGRTLQQHHERFRQLAKAEATGWGIAEHAELCSVMEHLALFDQVDVTNLAGCEMMFRRLQTIEFSYLEKVRSQEGQIAGGRLTPEEQAMFLGMTKASSSLMLCPALLDHVRAEAEKQGSLAKNLRKARDNRQPGQK